MIRKDFRASVDVDSSDAGSFNLPWSFAGGVKYGATRRISVAGQVLYRTWSSVDSFLVANGAPGSGNTIDVSMGAEYVRNLQRPGNLPVRLGLRYATLPYRTSAGALPSEFAITAGTALRFAKDRAGFDVALDKTWRKDDEDRSESSWLVYVGASIRP
jgi:opacity protein-like surface antigen